MEEKPLPATIRSWFESRAVLFKLMGAGFFALLLLIPLGMVRSTLFERQARFHEAVHSITETWGPAQQILGPVLVVPYTYQDETEVSVDRNGQRVLEKRVREQSAEAYFLPERLEVTARLEPSERRRGIYVTHVYAADVHVAGRFEQPDLSFLEADGVAPHWDRARVSIAASDLRGMRDTALLTWNDADVAMEPETSLAEFGRAMSCVVPVATDDDGATFSLDLTLNGTDQLFVVPTGRATVVSMSSPWPAPSFSGAFLPVERSVSAEGFEAQWQVSYYGRGVPQRWTNRAGELAPRAAAFQASAFGVTLMNPVNAYRTVERAIKYGVLFIVLVFATFFIFEVTCGLRLSALNYLLVGAALCLFFLGLLALSEFIPFGTAYSASASASILLIGLYSRRILQRRDRAWLVGGLLGGVYAYLYLVLQMEDFSLLAGTGVLFVVLAALMYATRDFNATGSTRRVAAGTPTG